MVSNLILFPRRLKPYGGRPDDILHRIRIAGGRSVPHAGAKSGDVDLIYVGGVGYHAVAILEIEPSDPAPCLAPVDRAPSRGFESGGVHQIGIARVYRYVVYAPAAIQHILPVQSGVGRQVDAAVGRRR